MLPADFDPSKLPPRQFIVGKRFMAGAVTLGVAPPGTGKSSFSILTALSIATGRSLTREAVHRSGAVWIHNNEDSIDELYRRIAGILRLCEIDSSEVCDRLYVTSGLDEPLVVAVKDNDSVRRTAAVAEVIRSIKEKGIVHIAGDPFVSTHRGVSENSNEEIEQVAEAFRHIAHETGCSIDLIHHTLKSHSRNSEEHAGDMNAAARGAGALTANARIVYTLAQMSKKTGDDLKVPPHIRVRLIRLDQGKGNYSAREPSACWFELQPVSIGNGVDDGDGFMVGGDTVAVPVPWTVGGADTAADQEPKPEDPREARRQRVRDRVAQAMSAERCEISAALHDIAREFGVQNTTARKCVMAALSEENECPAQGDGVCYLLKLEREQPSPPGKLFIVRRIADALAAHSTGTASSTGGAESSNGSADDNRPTANRS